MKNDHLYAEMLGVMREQGAKDNPLTLQLGVMQSPTSVRIDDLVLKEEDIYIADYLLAGYSRQLKVPYVSAVSVDTTQESGFTDNTSDPDVKLTKQTEDIYTDGLKKGDLVAVQKLNNNNMYVILARVLCGKSV